MNQIKSYISLIVGFNLLFFACNISIFSSSHEFELRIDGKEKTELFKKGINALNSKDTLSAEQYFKESVSKNGDAASYYELAKIYLARNTFLSRNIAYEHFRKAALLEPDNMEYRYAFADLMKSFARRSSMKEYKRIIALDSNQTNAFINLGDMKAKDFNEYNHSVRSENGVSMSLQEFANKDFIESEKYFLSALSLDSLNYDTIMKLALLYERANKPQKGIDLLNRLINANKADKDVHLLLGLLYYKTSHMLLAQNEYRKAIDMMDRLEKLDFTLYSVLLTMKDSNLFENNSVDDDNVEIIINSYWKASDPLFLTDYNERLLEHYSRVAYANLNFGVPSLGIAGWKTDMGETFIRYGEPLNRVRLRPSMGSEGTVSMKTELWNYEQMNVAFSDPFSNGYYQYVWPAGDKDKLVPQIPGNYVDFMEDLKRTNPTMYRPKYEGPTLDVPYLISQFKSYKKNLTDLYINLYLPDTGILKTDSIDYKVGIFFFDTEYHNKYSSTKNLFASKNSESLHTVDGTLQPGSGFLAFELIRGPDKGTFSSHIDYQIKEFNETSLDMSDLLIAEDITSDRKPNEYLQREDVFIKPYIRNKFIKDEPIFLYYEIYNLERDKQGLTNFEQSLMISEYSSEKKSGLSKIFSSITNFLGITEETKITLKSNYKTLEENPKIYFQLDLSNFEPGEYQIKILIKDNLSGLEKEVSRIIYWQM